MTQSRLNNPMIIEHVQFQCKVHGILWTFPNLTYNISNKLKKLVYPHGLLGPLAKNRSKKAENAFEFII